MDDSIAVKALKQIASLLTQTRDHGAGIIRAEHRARHYAIAMMQIEQITENALSAESEVTNDIQG